MPGIKSETEYMDKSDEKQFFFGQSEQKILSKTEKQACERNI